MQEIKLYGIIWNSKFPFVKDIIDLLSKKFKMSNLKEIDTNGVLKKFIKDIYPSVLPEKYVDYKVSHLQRINCKKILFFNISIVNPHYEYNEQEQHTQCIEAKNIKTIIRKKFSPMIENYVTDIMFHLADNEDENKIILDGVLKYTDRMTSYSIEELSGSNYEF